MKKKLSLKFTLVFLSIIFSIVISAAVGSVGIHYINKTATKLKSNRKFKPLFQ